MLLDVVLDALFTVILACDRNLDSPKGNIPVFHIFQRNQHRKRRPHPNCTSQRDATAHKVRELLANTETQASSAKLFAETKVSLYERLKHSLLLSRRYTGTSILHLEFELQNFGIERRWRD